MAVAMPGKDGVITATPTKGDVVASGGAETARGRLAPDFEILENPTGGIPTRRGVAEAEAMIVAFGEGLLAVQDPMLTCLDPHGAVAAALAAKNPIAPHAVGVHQAAVEISESARGHPGPTPTAHALQSQMDEDAGIPPLVAPVPGLKTDLHLPTNAEDTPHQGVDQETTERDAQGALRLRGLGATRNLAVEAEVDGGNHQRKIAARHLRDRPEADAGEAFPRTYPTTDVTRGDETDLLRGVIGRQDAGNRPMVDGAIVPQLLQSPEPMESQLMFLKMNHAPHHRS